MAIKKMTLSAALLVALVAVATASTFTTTVTTTTFEDEGNPGQQQQQQCQRQLQGRRFRSCQSYLSEHGSVLEMTSTGNPGQQQQEESLRECCQQLKNVNEQCRCEAIRSTLKQMQQKEGEQEQQQMGQSQVYQKAMELPRMCNMTPQHCQIKVVFV